MADPTSRPFLINKDEDGKFRLTVRTTRYNSQGYPARLRRTAGRDFRHRQRRKSVRPRQLPRPAR